MCAKAIDQSADGNRPSALLGPDALGVVWATAACNPIVSNTSERATCIALQGRRYSIIVTILMTVIIV
jgi:hypothetical protein